MAEDTRNYIERTMSLSEKNMGHTPTVDELAGQFAKTKKAERIGILDGIDADLASDDPVSLGTNEFKKLMQLRQHRRALGSVHNALRRAHR